MYTVRTMEGKIGLTPICRAGVLTVQTLLLLRINDR